MHEATRDLCARLDQRHALSTLAADHCELCLTLVPANQDPIRRTGPATPGAPQIHLSTGTSAPSTGRLHLLNAWHCQHSNPHSRTLSQTFGPTAPNSLRCIRHQLPPRFPSLSKDPPFLTSPPPARNRLGATPRRPLDCAAALTGASGTTTPQNTQRGFSVAASGADPDPLRNIQSACQHGGSIDGDRPGGSHCMRTKAEPRS
ncbi:hypothetical protein L209DRAFT_76414 [Thermothelomyces heterothallicus CBS 203.75]